MEIFALKAPFLGTLSSTLGVPEAKINLIFLQLFTIPLSFLLYFIKNGQMRLIYSFVLGLWLQYSIYGLNFLHVFSSTLTTYFFIMYFGRKRSAFWVLIITVTHLSCLHVYRMIVDYGNWTLDDPTTIYMMTICKFSSLAFSYEDGAKDDKDFRNEHMKTYKVIEKPTLLEVCSYVYFFPTALVGPSFEFKDFIDFIYLKDCYTKTPNGKMMTSGVFYLLFSFVFMIAYAFGSPKLPIDYIGKVDFGLKPLYYKLIYLNLSLLLARTMYLSGWVLAYSCLIFNGLAYTETKVVSKKNDTEVVDIVQSFDKGIYGSFLIAEFGSNPKTKMIYWNHSVHLWLKYNVYLRSINIEQKPFKNNFLLASFLTFITSAIWHGFYPIYFIVFIAFHLYQDANEVFDKKGFFKIVDNNILLHGFMCLFTTTMFNLVGVSFLNLRWTLFLQTMHNFNWLMIIGVGLMYGVSKCLPSAKRSAATGKPTDFVKDEGKEKKQ